MFYLKNQLNQSNLNNDAQNTVEQASYDARVLELSDPVSLQILLVPVRLIFEDNSKSPDAFEEETIKNLTQATCPMTKRKTIGYIYDDEKKAEVTVFLTENPAACSMQYRNGTWQITRRINNLTSRQDFITINFSDIYLVVFSGIIIGAVHGGGFLAASSALGAAIMQNKHQEINRQAQTAWVGGAITTAAAYYLTMAYRLFYINHTLKNREVALMIITFIFAALSSIPVGAQIVPFKQHNLISSMMVRQLLGSFIIAIGLVALDYYFSEKDTTEHNNAVTTSDRATRQIIPFLPHYFDSASSNPLQLSSCHLPESTSIKTR